MSVQNASQKPEVMYGMHFYPGVAEYAEPDKKPYRIFLNEQTIRDMDQTFAGCPVYVQHVDEVNLDNIQHEADGYVIESFYNSVDGKHWVKFIVVSDKGRDAIKRGWRLSNAYVPEAFGPGGLWNGVEYQKEVTRASYEHLALVPDPRYAESIILTKSQFKSYNENLELELKKVANSKETSKVASFLNLFKKTPVDQAQAAEFEASVVRLKNGKEISIAELVKNAEESEGQKLRNEESEEGEKVEKHAEHKAEEDKSGEKDSEEQEEKQGHKDEEKGAAPQMANMEHHVMVGNKSMPLHEMMKEHESMRNYMDAMSQHHAKYMQAADEDGGEKDAAKPGAAEDADLTKRNADEDGGEKEASDQMKEADKTKRNSNFKKLADAPHAQAKKSNTDQLYQLDRGRSKYGSGR